ncbi:hypothetical protein FHG87_018436 [Trinorchestia longiramus]|nr:hypothetical protein FHG87_018436 [Trinorchestia longiramus]
MDKQGSCDSCEVSAHKRKVQGEALGGICVSSCSSMSGELPATNGHSNMDASLMLEAALQQMDGIIAGL